MGKVVSILTGAAIARRNKLVTDHLPMVRAIARQLKNRVPPCFEVDDLEQSGMIGLIQAARDFDPGRGTPFAAYARKRIRGEMVESIRKRNWEESTRDPIAEHRGDDDDAERGPAETRDNRALGEIETLLKEREHRDLFDRIVAALDDRQAFLIVKYYREEVSMEKIAQSELFIARERGPKRQVNASRVSQIHSAAIEAIRSYLERSGYRKAA